MSEIQNIVLKQEHGILRLYGLEDDAEGLQALRAAVDGDGDGDAEAIAALLGVETVETEWLDLIDRHDISALGIEQFLAQAYEVDEAQLAEAAANLASAPRHVLIVPSRAFAGTEQVLQTRHPLIPIAQFDTDPPPAILRPLGEAERSGPVATASGGAPKDEGRPVSSQMRMWIVGAGIALAVLVVALAVFAGAS